MQSGIGRPTLRPVPAGIVRLDEFLNKVPRFLVDDSLVLAIVDLAIVLHLPDVGMQNADFGTMPTPFAGGFGMMPMPPFGGFPGFGAMPTTDAEGFPAFGAMPTMDANSFSSFGAMPNADGNNFGNF